MKLGKTLSFLSITTVLLFSLYACSRNENSASGDKARLQVYLTDDPAKYDAVNIDIKDVMINYSNDTASGWQSLANVYTGNYDILKLVNDQDTLLANAELNTGRVEQIRLILGSNNYVRIGGTNYPLETPSAQQSGLKINLHQNLSAGVLYKLLLDFDAARSIHKTGNGKYMLKPTIRATLEAIGGSLKGFVKPDSVQTKVFAIQGSDTVAGTLTSAGNYFIRGINAGSYNLSFVPADTPTHKITTKTGVVVTNGAVTTVDTVTLVK